jgi:serine/threonine-protein kinase
MTPAQTCPDCGADLPRNGYCVRCLLELGKQAGREPDEPTLLNPGGKLCYFGDYEISEMIGRGGMGVVYRARQASLERVVALKMIRSAFLASELEVHRFLNEAKSAAMLDHPNIVPIFEVGEHEGQHYFSMRLVEGGNLAQRIAMGEFQASNESSSSATRDLPMRNSAGLVAKVARAVHHAHQRGIMHRDLKPSNILIDLRGEPQVSDFGLARLANEETSATLTNETLGTPAYMAPEQATRKTKQLTTGVDVYGLGVILFELLTGRVPFRAATAFETIRQVVEDNPERPSSINPRLDRNLETICLKCLEKEPGRRYDSAAALADDLDRWLEHRPITARRTPAWERVVKWVRREPLKAALLVLIAIAAGGPFIVSRFYIRHFSHMATEHPVTTPDRDGVYSLRLFGRYKDDRCTDNFWRGPMEHTNRLMRLEFTNVPPELLSTLGCLIRADIAGQPDPARTPVVTNGQTFWLKVESDLDRDFYVASVGWHASNVLSRASNATIKLILLP